MQSSLRHRLLTALLLTIAALASTQQELPAQIRIACLGDSITFGALIDDREHSSYPAWLNEHLGEGSLVRNFGVGGATMLLAADKPYLRTDACRDAIGRAARSADSDKSSTLQRHRRPSHSASPSGTKTTGPRPTRSPPDMTG